VTSSDDFLLRAADADRANRRWPLFSLCVISRSCCVVPRSCRVSCTTVLLLHPVSAWFKSTELFNVVTWVLRRSWCDLLLLDRTKINCPFQFSNSSLSKTEECHSSQMCTPRHGTRYCLCAARVTKSPYTDTNLGTAHCLASRAPTLELWLVITSSRKFVIQVFVWITKFKPQIPSLLQAKMVQKGKLMNVGARECFSYNSVKLVLLANCNRYEVNSNTFIQMVKPFIHLNHCTAPTPTTFDTLSYL
jgi:hypothetical protein